MFKLVICDDEGKTTIVPLIRDEITIGRREGNTIRLTDRNVSRQHARLLRQGDNDFLVTDLRSRNGTKVNGDAVVGDKPHRVVPGDQIYIGDYNLSIRTDVSAGVPMGRQMDPGDTAGIGKVTPHARLVMLAGPAPGTEFELTVNLYVVGRSEEANLRIEDSSISRAHARLDGDDQQWTISDLDSINGILVNGQRRDDYLLKSGDVIELGVVRLRFVAPGEPYEYTPGESLPSAPAVQKPRSNRLFLLLGALAIAAAAAIVIAILLGRSDGGGEQKAAGGGAPTATKGFEQLVEEGKDKMQAESWAEAARLFAEAQQLKPDDARVRELKNTSLAEMDAQAALVAGITASQNKDYRSAVDNLSKIPRSSRYYNTEQLQKMVALLCRELIAAGLKAIEDGAGTGAVEKIIAEIGLLPEMSDECRSDREALLLQLNRRDQERGASPGTSPEAQPGSQKPKKGEIPVNPYESRPRNPYDNPYADGPGSGSRAASKPAPAADPPQKPRQAPVSTGDDELPPAKKSSHKMTGDTP